MWQTVPYGCMPYGLNSVLNWESAKIPFWLTWPHVNCETLSASLRGAKCRDMVAMWIDLHCGPLSQTSPPLRRSKSHLFHFLLEKLHFARFSVHKHDISGLTVPYELKQALFRLSIDWTSFHFPCYRLNFSRTQKTPILLPLKPPPLFSLTSPYFVFCFSSLEIYHFFG